MEFELVVSEVKSVGAEASDSKHNLLGVATNEHVEEAGAGNRSCFV